MILYEGPSNYRPMLKKKHEANNMYCVLIKQQNCVVFIAWSQHFLTKQTWFLAHLKLKLSSWLVYIALKIPILKRQDLWESTCKINPFIMWDIRGCCYVILNN